MVCVRGGGGNGTTRWLHSGQHGTYERGRGGVDGATGSLLSGISGYTWYVYMCVCVGGGDGNGWISFSW